MKLLPNGPGCALLLWTLAALFGCSQPARLSVADSPLLEEHFPAGYPSSDPVPNRVIRQLREETVTVVADGYEKDFHYYRVRTEDGLVGYLIDGPGVARVDREPGGRD